MDYETNIEIKQYHPQGMFYYTLEILHLENGDFTYEGECPTLDDVMDCIKTHQKQHLN